MATPDVVATIAGLRERLSHWRKAGARIGLVPTMGALHAGHLSLVGETRRRCNRVVASIFVNPAQFAPHEDFDRYPRTLEKDLESLAGKVDLVFAPSVAEMYPDGFATRIEVAGPALGLEADFRPHFFAGVATVVAKLLVAAAPDLAVFGAKDYQQLLVIKRLVGDLSLPVEIVGGDIVREPDGLAMSSRNAYLDPRERAIAGKLNLILQDIASRARSSAGTSSLETRGIAALVSEGFDSVDYVAIRDAETLERLDTINRPARILAAAHVGKTRLIDNFPV